MSGGIVLSSSKPSREQILIEGVGLKGWTHNKNLNPTSTGQGNGELLATLAPFVAGDVITNVVVVVMTVSSGLTLAKLGVYATNQTLLASSADMKASLTATGPKVAALTAPYTVTSTGVLYLAQVQVGTTPARLLLGGVVGPEMQAISGSIRQSGRQLSQTDFPATATLTDAGAGVWFGWN